MATLDKKNETVVAPFFKNGVTLQHFNVSFESTVASKLDTDYTSYSGSNARSPVAVALEAIAQACSIEVIGTVQNNGTGAGRDLRIAVAALGGDFGTDTWDGSNSETFAVYLTSLVTAAGTRQGVNLANSTVTSYTF
jgi:hypothetical protein